MLQCNNEIGIDAHSKIMFNYGIHCCVSYYFILKWWKGILTLPGVMKLRDTALTMASRLTHWTAVETKGKLSDLMFNQFPVVSRLGVYLLSSRERFLQQLSVCIPLLIAALLYSKYRNPGGIFRAL